MDRFITFWFPFVIVLIWVLASGIAIVCLSPGDFQRLGTIGIAGAIALFSGQKYRIASLFNTLSGEELREKIHRLELQLAGLEIETAEMAILQKKDGEFGILSERLAYHRANIDRMEKLSDQAEEHNRKIRPKISRVERDVIFTEVAVLGFATLQTGYGDKLIGMLL